MTALTTSPEAYWTEAIASIAAARLGLKGKDPASVWRQVEWLTVLEQLARACLALAGEKESCVRNTTDTGRIANRNLPEPRVNPPLFRFG
jgi:hypothetical protein